MSRYDHKIETSLEGIEHLSKEKKGERERKKSSRDHKKRSEETRELEKRR